MNELTAAAIGGIAGAAITSILQYLQARAQNKTARLQLILTTALEEWKQQISTITEWARDNGRTADILPLDIYLLSAWETAQHLDRNPSPERLAALLRQKTQRIADAIAKSPRQ